MYAKMCAAREYYVNVALLIHKLYFHSLAHYYAIIVQRLLFLKKVGESASPLGQQDIPLLFHGLYTNNIALKKVKFHTSYSVLFEARVRSCIYTMNVYLSCLIILFCLKHRSIKNIYFLPP